MADYRTENLEVIRQSRIHLLDCLSGHADSCPRPSETMPTRLLHLTQTAGYPERILIRLVNSAECGTQPYAALSYCWGGDQILKLTHENQPRLASGVTVDELPATIRDACVVSIELQIVYLWVDSLCIFQGDAQDKNHEVGRMDLVYLNSTVTISAARARSVADGFLSEKELWGPGPEGHIEPLDTRGWALQETVLSPRLLRFTTFYPMIQFSCQLNTHSRFGLNMAAVTQHKWCDLVEDYTSRQLSFATDRIAALAGIINAVNRISTTSVICSSGVFLKRDGAGGQTNAGLLWRSAAPSNSLNPKMAMHLVPSWSWVSCPGPVLHPTQSKGEGIWASPLGKPQTEKNKINDVELENGVLSIGKVVHLRFGSNGQRPTQHWDGSSISFSSVTTRRMKDAVYVTATVLLDVGDIGEVITRDVSLVPLLYYRDVLGSQGQVVPVEFKGLIVERTRRVGGERYRRLGLFEDLKIRLEGEPCVTPRTPHADELQRLFQTETVTLE